MTVSGVFWRVFKRRGAKDDLKIDTRAEESIVHTEVNIKPVNADSESRKIPYHTEFLIIAVLLACYILFINIEKQNQFGVIPGDLAENRRLLEANAIQLASLRS